MNLLTFSWLYFAWLIFYYISSNYNTISSHLVFVMTLYMVDAILESYYACVSSVHTQHRRRIKKKRKVYIYVHDEQYTTWCHTMIQ